MSLAWCFASRADANEFARFECWDGAPGKPWEEEVEYFVQFWALGHEHVLAFREADALVAVSVFDRRTISVPIHRPSQHPAWHLQVVAIHANRQNAGLSSEVFSTTFGAMRDADPDRVLITANVHRENGRSIRAAERVDLLPHRVIDESYVELLGEVPEG